MEENLQNIIPFEVNEENDILVSARELHKFLEIKTLFRTWFPRMTEYGFEEGEDYIKLYEKSNTSGGEQMIVDYMMKIDMAKEIAMIQRSEKGKAARKYFIEVEKKFKTANIALANLLKLTNDNSNTNEVKILEDSPNSNLITNFRDSAKIIGVRENMLVNYLLINNFCYRDKDSTIKPYSKYMDYFVMREYTTSHGHSGVQTLINGKGRETFKNLMIDENIIKEEKLLEVGE